MLDETRIRLDAIHHVRLLREKWVAVPASELRDFQSDGLRVFLKGQQGIFKPAELSLPLSITTTIDSPYANDVVQGGRVMYDFVARDHENQGLMRCAEEELPVIYLLQVTRRPPEYVVFAPAYVIGWDESERRFLIDLSEQRPGEVVSPPVVERQLALPAFRSNIRDAEAAYEITAVERRLYEARFRNAVLDAYRDRCAVCLLHVRPLLDAAHVSPEIDPKGAIDVRGGIALCSLHHRSFNAGLLRYDDSYIVRIDLGGVSPGDGEAAMLLAFDGKALTLPADRDLWPRQP